MKEIMNYVNRWYVFVLALVISFTLAFFYLKYATPTYKITSTLLIEDDKNKGEGILKGTPFGELDMFKTAKTVDNEMEVLRSKDLLMKVIKSLDMQVSYKVKRPFQKKELYGKELPVKVVIHRLKKGAYSKQLSLKVVDEDSYMLTDSNSHKLYRFYQLVYQPDFVISVEKGPAFKAKFEEVFFNFNDVKKLAEAYNMSKLSVMPVVKDANTIVLSLEDAVPQRGVDFSKYLNCNV